MTRIPDAVAVASLDTHRLIVAVPNEGPVDLSCNMPRTVAAQVLRQIADQLETPAGRCSTALATGRPCPEHDAPAPAAVEEQPAPAGPATGVAKQLAALYGKRCAIHGDQCTGDPNIEHDVKPLADAAPQRPAGLDALLDHVAAGLPVEEQQPEPAVVRCAHDYGLMRDSCPGCDAEQERPHEADPVTVRPRWAKRDMRRCRRCSLIPSHRIHRAPQAAE